MLSCPNCGAPGEGRFCAKCGAPLPGTDAGTPGAGPGTGPQPVAISITDNVAGALCYVLLGITGILFLVLAPYNRNRSIRFHAFQSIFFTVALVIAWIVLGIVAAILATIPFVGPLSAALLGMTLSLASFVVWVILIYRAYNNQQFQLPVIGPLAEKQA